MNGFVGASAQVSGTDGPTAIVTRGLVKDFGATGRSTISI